MTGGGVAATDNDSWVVAGLHSAVWSGGRVRYLAVLGEASLNLDYYYGSEKVDLSENPLHFNLEGTLLVQQAQFRLGDSRLFAGMRYMFFVTDIGFYLPASRSASSAGPRTRVFRLARLRRARQHVYAEQRPEQFARDLLFRRVVRR